jgi:hypothetical protein
MVQLSQFEFYCSLVCAFALGVWIKHMHAKFKEIAGKRREVAITNYLEKHPCHIDMRCYDKNGNIRKDKLI